jgi:hypothetical protein
MFPPATGMLPAASLGNLTPAAILQILRAQQLQAQQQHQAQQLAQQLAQHQQQGINPAIAALASAAMPRTLHHGPSANLGMRQANYPTSAGMMNTDMTSPLFNSAQLWAANSIIAQQDMSLNFGGTGMSSAATNMLHLGALSQSAVMPSTSAFAGLDNTSNGNLTGRQPILLYTVTDEDSLSEYQCLVRKQIEVFEALQDDTRTNAQGRNKPIVLGQVGIRCRHCMVLPLKERRRGAVYYPAKLDSVYQAARNMATGHLAERCQHLPADIKQELVKLLDHSRSSIGAGKQYWADGLRSLGVFEDQDGLRFIRTSGIR